MKLRLINTVLSHFHFHYHSLNPSSSSSPSLLSLSLSQSPHIRPCPYSYLLLLLLLPNLQHKTPRFSLFASPFPPSLALVASIFTPGDLAYSSGVRVTRIRRPWKAKRLDDAQAAVPSEVADVPEVVWGTFEEGY